MPFGNQGAATGFDFGNRLAGRADGYQRPASEGRCQDLGRGMIGCLLTQRPLVHCCDWMHDGDSRCSYVVLQESSAQRAIRANSIAKPVF